MKTQHAVGAPLSLPQSGGAIRGIGETFQPNAFDGTATFSFPIATSSGRGGLAPELLLRYGSGLGNGPFGLGWQLSVPSIRRKTEKGLPRYNDRDVFQISGAEDLVPKLAEGSNAVEQAPWPGYSVTRYQPRTEGSFARIEKWFRSSDSDVHWRVTTIENVTHIYGRTATARIADPKNSAHVFEWLLQETFDAKGNHILYEYAQDDSDLAVHQMCERNRSYAQRYLRRIYLGNYPEAPAGQSLKYENSTDEVGVMRSGIDHKDQLTVIPRRYAIEMIFDYYDWDAVDWDHVEAWADGNENSREDDIPSSETERKRLNSRPSDGAAEIFGGPPASASLPIGRTAVPLREDRFSTFRSGFEVRTMRRCRRVLTYHHFYHLGQPTLVKAMNFLYSQNPHNHVSFLHKVITTGYRRSGQGRKYTQRAMPALVFDYSEFRPHQQRYQNIVADDDQLPDTSLRDPDVALADMFGDGLPDIVETRPEGIRYWRNLGGGRLARPKYLQDSPAQVRLSQSGVSFADVDGNGRTDLVVHQGPLHGYFELERDGEWSSRSFQHYDTTPPFDFSAANVRLIDLTGDGASDMLVTTDQGFVWYQGNGKAGFSEQQRTLRISDLDRFPDVQFGDSAGRVRLADMTGDGLKDIVLVHDGRIDYWPNLGYGEFGHRITMEETPTIGPRFDARRLHLVDLDGSGVADLVYVDLDEVRFWFNRSGNSWSPAQVIGGTPPTSDLTGFHFADFFGNGTTCLIWSYDRLQYPDGNYKLLDFTGGVKPYLLTGMSNSMGTLTRIGYASSTSFYLEDERRPSTRWLTRLPVPIHVVARTETVDLVGRSKLVTTYRYRHGYFDGREREFRGFAFVEQTDTESFEGFSESKLLDEEFDNGQRAYMAPPTVTRTWYHTGFYYDEDSDGLDVSQFYARLRKKEFYGTDSAAFAVPDSTIDPTSRRREAYRTLHGALLRSEIYSLDGTPEQQHPYQVVDRSYRVHEIQAARDNPHAVFLRTPQDTITWNYERDPSDPRISHTIAARVDGFGNVTDELEIHYPRRSSTFDEQKRLLTTYEWNRFVNRTDRREYYYAGKPCERRRFEIKQPPPGWNGDRLLKAADFTSLLVDDSAPASRQFHDFEDRSDSFDLRMLEWEQTYYRKDANASALDSPTSYAQRLPLGQIERVGLPYESYTATLTPKMLAEVFDGKATTAMLRDAGYVDSAALDTGDSYWPSNVNSAMGYFWTPSGKQAFESRGFYSPIVVQDPFGNRRETDYDFVDQNGTRYDLFFFPVTTRDELGNEFKAVPDYRVEQPFRTTDPNGAIREVAYDALGMAVATCVRGNQGEGDRLYHFDSDQFDAFDPDLTRAQISAWLVSPETAGAQLLGRTTSRIVYDMHVFADRHRQNSPTVAPVFSATLERERHDAELQATSATASTIQHRFSYSDGFGRIVQTKSQSTRQSTACWLSTGAAVLNNKAQPVKRFEPFYASDHRFGYQGFETHGVSSTLFYDPLQRVVGMLSPNHTYEKTVLTPWRQEKWDACDTMHHSHRYAPGSDTLPDHSVSPISDPHVGRHFERLPQSDFLPTWYGLRMDLTAAAQAWPDPIVRAAEQEAARQAGRHAATPAVEHFDCAGRPFLAVQDNGDDALGSPVLFRTNISIDIEGLTLNVRDARNNDVFQHQFDMAGHKARVQSRDAGLKQTLFDVLGAPAVSWDANNETRIFYDPLRRPREVWVKDLRTANSPFVLVEKTIYGEERTSPHASYHRGQVWKSYDGAGLAENVSFDFKGNLLETRRQLLGNATQVVEWATHTDPSSFTFQETTAAALLDPALDYVAATEFDALNRVLRNVTPDGTVQEPRYDASGRLAQLFVSQPGTSPPTEFVSAVDYNARGQRERIVFGNGVTTTYSYNANTFRLEHLRSRRSGAQSTKDLQDLRYTYDPVGNVTNIRDDAHVRHFNRGAVIEPACRYMYDSVYRLIESTGREHEAMSACHYRNGSSKNTELVAPFTQPAANGQALGNYTERYEYDAASNLTLIDHHNRTTNTHWKRDQTFAGQSNQLLTSRAGCVGEGTFAFSHDGTGNIEALPHLPELRWDHNHRLVEVQLNAGASPNRAFYQYDSSGQRVRKTVVKNGGTSVDERIYLGLYEIYTERRNGTVTLHRDTVHVMDDQSRIATIERERDPSQSTTVTASHVRYQLTNHLGSSMLEIDDTPDAKIIAYEEYYAYGGTAYLAARGQLEASLKRYRYSGKERDDESGFYYYGARYYAPWLGRWISPDPAGPIDGYNLFAFTLLNPVTRADARGCDSDDFNFTNDELNQWEQSFDKDVRDAEAKQAEKAKKTKALEKVEKDFFERGTALEKRSPKVPKKRKGRLVAGVLAATLGGSAAVTDPEAPKEPPGKAQVLRDEERKRQREKPSKPKDPPKTGPDPKGGGASGGSGSGPNTDPDKGPSPDNGKSPDTSGSKSPRKPSNLPDLPRPPKGPPSRLARLGEQLLEVAAKRGSKFVPVAGTGAGVASAGIAWNDGKKIEAVVELIGASEIPYLAQTADAALLAQDAGWVVKEALDPEQKLEAWYYRTFLE